MAQTSQNDVASKIDGFLRLLDTQQVGFERRCNVEWKMSAILWTGIIVLSGFLKKELSSLSSEACYIYIPYIAFFIAYVVWIGKLGSANRIDKAYKNYYRNEVEKLLGVSIKTVDHPKEFYKLHYDGWLILEIIFTAIFLFGSWFFLCKLQPSVHDILHWISLIHNLALFPGSKNLGTLF